MSFYEDLCRETAPDRNELLSRAVIADCLAGRVSIDTYIAFLIEAYHHVKHTVPLLMGCGSRLPDRLEWLRAGIVEYIDEEHGHEQWILDDIEACGCDSRAAAERGPGLATELMISFAYDMIQRRNPVGFFGMVHVLEGTSVAIASRAADIIEARLGLGPEAFRYLRSHGSIDAKHVEDFERLVNRFAHLEDRAAVVHTARTVFKLYGDVFDSLPRASTANTREVA